MIRAATYTENFIVSAANKLTIETKAREVEALLVKALYEAKAASDAGAKWENMNEPIMAIRYSQWRWDFAMSSHGLYAHNPEEGKQLLDKAIEQASEARHLLAGILKQFNVTQVSYPDIRTKEKAHQAIGLVEADLIKEKQKFIENDVKKHWQPVSQYGY